MYKKSKNPKVEELTKTYTDRIYPVSNLPMIPNDLGVRSCVWCGDPLKSNHHATRYCKDPECPNSLYAWGNPQGDEGKRFLLEKQGWKCNICAFDWEPFKKSIFVSPNCKTGKLLAKERRPEVDHIVPIYKGGQSLGLDNHQAICYTCHKTKTKSDLSGRRKKNETDPNQDGD